jgi:hypothetical protein
VNSQLGGFNEYVNSPEGAWGLPVAKKIIKAPADQDQTKEHVVGPDSVNADSPPVLQGISAKWQVCTTDSDCTATVADCATWEALNKKYLSKIAKNLKLCSVSIDPGFQPETVCVAKACKTTDKNTQVSWEEWLSAMRKPIDVPRKGKI